MPGRFTQSEFIARAVGIPWVKWRSDWRACDCYGLLVLYFREVLGVELDGRPDADTGENLAFADGWQGWEPCGPEHEAACFVGWQSGIPHHCGVVVAGGGMVLHSDGTENRPGNVRLTRLSTMQHLYADLRFYRYTSC